MKYTYDVKLRKSGIETRHTHLMQSVMLRMIKDLRPGDTITITRGNDEA